ncbi:MAG TPA: pyridoxal-phosphate dependent enzyme [Ignavibacteriaceae bacterium]|jgi:1-aminocyclopropane-1-carboxylate deaminase|nr:pyridoxal-phosphate dependent enzyme [Ignavibacteriaceae bacterium]
MTVEEKVLSFPLKQAPLVKISDPLLKKNKLSLYIKREDLIHPYIFGNKWYKLKYNLIEAEKQNKKTLLTFGGAYSNHIFAVAAAGSIFGFKTIGIIRGEEHLPFNPVLNFAKKRNMLINYVSRTDYRKRADEDFISKLHKVYGNFYLLPEGGTNEFAVKGCAEIPSTIDINYEYICTACGTGGTIAGLIAGALPGTKVLGFPVLKGANFLRQKTAELLSQSQSSPSGNYEMFMDYHFGGYAKSNNTLLSFIRDFNKKNNFMADSIYFGKMLFGIYDLIRKGYFIKNKTIIAINSAPVENVVLSV